MNTFTRLRTARENEQGFTLVELLIVILIIGILAAIAVPVFLNQRQKANDAAVESDLVNKGMVMTTFNLKDTNGENRPDESDIDASAPTTKGVDWQITEYSASGFCLAAWHENGDKHTPEEPAYYASDAGGLVAAASESAACSYSIENGVGGLPEGGVGDGVSLNAYEFRPRVEFSRFDADNEQLVVSFYLENVDWGDVRGDGTDRLTVRLKDAATGQVKGSTTVTIDANFSQTSQAKFPLSGAIYEPLIEIVPADGVEVWGNEWFVPAFSSNLYSDSNVNLPYKPDSDMSTWEAYWRWRNM